MIWITINSLKIFIIIKNIPEARDSSPTATSILGPVEPLEGGGENESGKDGTRRSVRDVVVIDEAERHRPRRPYGGGRDRFDRFDRYGGEFGDRYDRYGGRGGRYGGDRFGTGGIYGSRGIYEEGENIFYKNINS